MLTSFIFHRRCCFLCLGLFFFYLETVFFPNIVIVWNQKKIVHLFLVRISMWRAKRKNVKLPNRACEPQHTECVLSEEKFIFGKNVSTDLFRSSLAPSLKRNLLDSFVRFVYTHILFLYKIYNRFFNVPLSKHLFIHFIMKFLMGKRARKRHKDCVLILAWNNVENNAKRFYWKCSV